MEALHNQLNAGETSGGEDQPQCTSPSVSCSSQPSASHQSNPAQDADSKLHRHGNPSKPPRRQLGRKRLRLQRKHAQDAETFKEDKLAGTSKDAGLSPGNKRGGSIQVSKDDPSGVPVISSSSSAPSHTAEEAQEGMPKQKRERKPQKPGKYVCSYCGRACAKPSVLQKHIRSHTGERPYPCAPCGFSFKTKSNLYKHRKSHTHRVKAGLAPSGKDEPAMSGKEEPLTDSEDESNRPPSTSLAKKQGMLPSQAPHGVETRPTEQSQGLGDSIAVKKRLAMRLSKTKQAPPVDSSDDISSSLGLGSRGSTESGYFSRSESTEQSQDSPPNSSAKSYAEIILGKYGRLGHLQRASRNQQQQSGGQEGKGIPFSLPKKQVIDHITKLITINEAVVDTSKIDSVKPRRFSLSRKSSSESVKACALKEPLVHYPKVTEAGSKGSGSITLGVPCQKFQQQGLNIEQSSGPASAAPLLRSLSVPSASCVSTRDAPRHLRLSQSFDEQSPNQTNRRHGLLRRQPAIELPIGSDFTAEKLPTTCSVPYLQDMLTVPHQKPRQIQPYECEECGTGCKDWESYKTHRRQMCKVHQTQKVQPVSVQEENPVRVHFMSRPGALVMRKRRKEDSLELDDPCSPIALSSTSGTSSAIVGEITSKTYEGPNLGNIGLRLEKDPERSLKGISVIQHTSSFEKQEGSMFVKSQVKDELDTCASYDMHHSTSPQSSEQQSSKPSFRKLVRQHNVQVPEILVTEDTNVIPMSPSASVSTAKEAERTEEFQWPQRSSTLAQLPIEKLPPKKKRLRLAEAAQSSGESSFESLSLPRSPSQDSNISHVSSRSVSFEDSGKPDVEMTSARRSRATHTLALPSSSHHHHREMRRSASEQAPHVPQQSTPILEVRSKSFDYSSLSPDRTPAGWRERRKCLLLKHTKVWDPDEEEQLCQQTTSGSMPSASMPTISMPTVSMPGISMPSVTSSSSMKLNPRPPEPPCTSTSHNTSPVHTHCQKPPALWQQDPPHHICELPEVSSNPSPDHVQLQQATPVVYMGLGGISLSSAHPTQGHSGAARAHYSPGSSGLKLEIPARDPPEQPELRGSFSSQVPVHPFQHQRVYFTITPNSEQLRPVGMQTVAVRVQGDIPTHASAIYTALSHNAVTQSQELSSTANHNVTLDVAVPSLDHSNPLTATPDALLQGCRAVGSGGNKRMLSPSNSMELGHEVQQQQKRVKEEDKGEEVEEDNSKEDATQHSNQVNAEPATESAGQASPHSLFSPTNSKETSMPTLHTKPEFSWCYLNYAKPSPSPQSDHQASVYSSWSTSAYNPNPPGLSSKEVLSLLHCKQGHSSVTYTTAPMSPPGEEKEGPAESRKPSGTEVHESGSRFMRL